MASLKSKLLWEDSPSGAAEVQLTGAGFTPKVAILLSHYGTAIDAFSDTAMRVIGIATDDATQYCVNNYEKDNDAGQACIRSSGAKIMRAYTTISNEWMTATVAFDDDGVTLTFTDSDAAGRDFAVLCLGGDALEDYKLVAHAGGGSAGADAVTGAGFHPGAFIGIGQGLTAAAAVGNDSLIGLSFCDGVNVYSCCGAGDNNADPTNAYSSWSNTKIFQLVDANAVYTAATFDGFNNDGMDLTWDTATGGSDPYWFILFLKGPSFKVGTDTQKTSTAGTKDTNTQFDPKCLLLGSNLMASATDTVSDHTSLAFGAVDADDGNAGVCNSNRDNNSSWSTAARYLSDDDALAVGYWDKILDAKGDVSLGTQKFTINWDDGAGGNPDATARVFGYLALGDSNDVTADSAYEANEALVQKFDATNQAFAIGLNLPAGRIAVGVVMDQADSSDQIKVELTEENDQTRTVNDANLANLPAAYFEDGVVYEVAAGEHNIIVTINSGTAEIRGVIIRAADARSGCVEDQGSGTHCRPLSCRYGGDLYQVHAEMYTGKIFLSKNGVAQEELFDSISGDYNERYHNGCAIIPCGAGLAAVQVGHNNDMNIKYSADGDFSASVSRALISGAGTATYAMLAVLANDDLLILTRADENSAADHLMLIRVSNVELLNSEVPSATYDYLAAGMIYPRMIDVQTYGGNELVFIYSQLRSSLDWYASAAMIYDPDDGANGSIFALNGYEGKTTIGTDGSERFNNTEYNTIVGSNGIEVLGNNSTFQRYIPGAIAWQPTNASPPKGEIFLMFIDCDNTLPTAYDTSEIRFCYMADDGTRTTSPGDFDAPTGLNTPNSYRVVALAQHQQGSDSCIVYVTNRATSTPSDDYESIVLYYDWGDDEVMIINCSDIFTDPVFEVARTINNPTGNFTIQQLEAAYGSYDEVYARDAINELHQTHRQAKIRRLSSSSASQSKGIANKIGIGV